MAATREARFAGRTTQRRVSRTGSSDACISRRRRRSVATCSAVERARCPSKWTDVLVPVGPAATRAARSATASSIPIVSAPDLESDPIESGWLASFAHPDGNLTGFFLDFPEFSTKWLQLLKDTVPGLASVVVLWDPATATVPNQSRRCGSARSSTSKSRSWKSKPRGKSRPYCMPPANADRTGWCFSRPRFFRLMISNLLT